MNGVAFLHTRSHRSILFHSILYSLSEVVQLEEWIEIIQEKNYPNFSHWWKKKSIQSCACVCGRRERVFKIWTLKQMIEIKHGWKESTYGKHRHRGRKKYLLFHEQNIIIIIEFYFQGTIDFDNVICYWIVSDKSSYLYRKHQSLSNGFCIV